VPAVEVLDFSPPAQKPDQLLDWAVDSPRAGSKEDVFFLQLSGWALGRDSRVVKLLIVHDGSVIRTVPVDYPREDVAASHPEAVNAKTCGFNVLVGVLGLPPDFTLHLMCVLEDGAKASLGSIHAVHEPVRSSVEPRLNPLMLTSLNRVGSTWMMGLFAAHPEIVVYRHYPYEYRSANYWAHMLNVLAQPANPVESSDPGDFHSDIWHVGNNPFYNRHVNEREALGKWLGQEYIGRLATFCHQSIDDWYTEVARSQGQQAPVYFAEKYAAGQVPVVMWELYPQAKEVFLVRDFRDMVCSLMSFYNGRARERADTDEEYVGQLRGWAFRLYKDWKSREEHSHLVRYEDLAMHPAETLTAILEYLELEASTEAVDSMLGIASAETRDLRLHRTTPNLSASIGRWRRDLTPSLQRACEETFGELLGAFGYSG
jgi:Sulfotransferase family